jgi:hypothetical protein
LEVGGGGNCPSQRMGEQRHPCLQIRGGAL